MSLAKLGEGPFQILEVFDPEYASYGGTSFKLPEPTNTLGKDDYESRCACCGAKLTWRVLVQSAASNLAYIVGLTCANRAENGIDVVKLNTIKNRAERRFADTTLANQEFAAYLRSQPHPMNFHGKSLYDSVVYYARKKTPNLSKLRAAWRAFDEAKAAGTLVNSVRGALEAFLVAQEARLKAIRHPFIKGRLTLHDYLVWTLANKHQDADYQRVMAIAREQLAAS